MKFKILNKINRPLFFILLLAAFVRISGLSWALPYHPHPDEWNMAAAITRLSWENKLNPEFFAYGQFPLYLAYFSAKAYNLLPWIKISQINTQEAIFFLRLWSAVAGVGLVYLVYLVSKSLRLSRQLSLVSVLLAALTPGLIQSSHFGTTESVLSFCFLGILYHSLKILQRPTIMRYLLAALFLGLALGSKISAVVFFVPLIVTTLFHLYKADKLSQKAQVFLYSLFALITSLALAVITSPYLVLNFKGSRGTLLYETQVAAGQSLVFYTRQFFDTVPVVFQMQKIFPFALGWPIFIMGVAGLVVLLTKVFKKSFFNPYFLVLVSFLAHFSSQAFLFCKWTRFMSPIFAFFPIFTGFFLSYLRNLGYLRYLIVGISLVPGLLFTSIYFVPDIRFTASEWIYQNIPSGSIVLSETANVVDIPVSSSKSLPPNPYHLAPISFDFYHLDENPELFPKLIEYLEKADYIFVPSKRLFANSLRLPEKYPLAARYHQLLFSGQLGFREIKKFKSFLINDEQAEETWSVFDHPVIRIYKKTVNLSKEDYEKLFSEI